MRSLRVLEHLSGEGGGVIWTQHANRHSGPGEVDQRLVLGGLLDLLPRAAGPDRLAHVMKRPAGGAREDPLDGRDDAGGVAAERDHVEHLDIACPATEALAQHRRLRPRHRDRHGRARPEPGLHERDHAIRVLLGAPVEEG